MSRTGLIDEQKSNTVALWDRIGIGASALCLIHCVFTSVALAMLPLLSLSFLEHEWVHQGLALFIVVVSALAFLPGYRRHRRPAPLLLAACGLLLLLTGAFFAHDLLDHAWETPLTVLGGLSMVSAHALNLRLASRCADCSLQ